MEFAKAYEPLVDELEALATFVRHTIRVAKSTAGSAALTTYALAGRLAKRPETADLVPHVADMRRALGRTGRKSKAVEPPPVATTTPKAS